MKPGRSFTRGGELSPRARLLRVIGVVVLAAFLVGYAGAAVWMWLGRSGQSVVTVPNLRDLPLAEATRVAERADLVMELADSLPHPEVEAGHVLTQSPLPGQEVGPGTAVQVILSAGRARYAVPDVAGMSRRQAEEVLQATGLQPVVEEVNDMRRPGMVVGTIPAAGAVVAIPATVRLQVSQGPPRVEVPDLLGVAEAEVGALLSGAGLTLGEVTRDLRMLETEGTVVGQQPAAGDSITVGEAVNIVVVTHQLEIFQFDDIR